MRHAGHPHSTHFSASLGTKSLNCGDKKFSTNQNLTGLEECCRGGHTRTCTAQHIRMCAGVYMADWEGGGRKRVSRNILAVHPPPQPATPAPTFVTLNIMIFKKRSYKWPDARENTWTVSSSAEATLESEVNREPSMLDQVLWSHTHTHTRTHTQGNKHQCWTTTKQRPRGVTKAKKGGGGRVHAPPLASRLAWEAHCCPASPRPPCRVAFAPGAE
jgi:hypothetical protein